METKVNRNKIIKIEIKKFNQTKLTLGLPCKKGKTTLWKKLDIPDTAGVYVLNLNKSYPGWNNPQTVDLHGPKSIGKIKYQPEGYKECKGWVYVGTTSIGLKSRFQRQIRKSNKNGNMIYKGVQYYFKEKDPISAVLRHGTLYWIKLEGIENTANRFFLESKMIAKLLPIFNVKSEH